jgi:hypothetical protein
MEGGLLGKNWRVGACLSCWRGEGAAMFGFDVVLMVSVESGFLLGYLTLHRLSMLRSGIAYVYTLYGALSGGRGAILHHYI